MPGQLPPDPGKLLARVQARIERRGPDECHPWTGGVNNLGYPVVNFTIDGRHVKRRVQRVMLLAAGVPFSRCDEIGLRCHDADLGCPGGRDCPHLVCCNPAHVYRVSRRDNPARRRRWDAVTHCPKGHEYRPANTGRGSKGERVCKACLRRRSKTASVTASQ